MEKRLESTETWFYRRLINIQCTEYMCKHGVLEKMETLIYHQKEITEISRSQ